MNNEPVAWGWYDLEIKRFFPHWDEDLMENKEGCIPLYTHPAKTLEPLGAKFEKVLNDNLWELMEESPAKTLTDEEIIEIGNAVTNLIDSNEGWIEFARAILRKAQNERK